MSPYQLLILRVHRKTCQWLLGSFRCSRGRGPCAAGACGREVHSFWPRQPLSAGSPRNWTFSNPELARNLCLEILEEKGQNVTFSLLRQCGALEGSVVPKTFLIGRLTKRGVKWVAVEDEPKLWHFLWLQASGLASWSLSFLLYKVAVRFKIISYV